MVGGGWPQTSETVTSLLSIRGTPSTPAPWARTGERVAGSGALWVRTSVAVFQAVGIWLPRGL